MVDMTLKQKLEEIESKRKELRDAEEEVKEAKQEMKEACEDGLELLNGIKAEIVEYRKLKLLDKMTQTTPLIESINTRTTDFLAEHEETETETKKGTKEE